MLLHFDSLLFDMQHDHVLKRLNFDLLTKSPGSGEGKRQAFDQKSRLICFIFIVRNYRKNIDNLLSYCEIYIIEF